MTKDTVTAVTAQTAMFYVKFSASAAAYCVEDVTGVRMVRVDEVMYGQEVGLMHEAADAIRAIPAGERPEIAVAALEALEAWEGAKEPYREVHAALELRGEVDADSGGMAQVLAAEERATAAYSRVKSLAG